MLCLATILHIFLTKIVPFFLLGPSNGRFPAIDVQRDLAIPSSVLFAPPVSSPCLGANEKIIFRRLDHRVAGHYTYVR